MTIVAYKDFQGSVKFEDGKLVIQILHIDDILLTECDAASEAQQAFEALVEEYLDTCKEVGKEPSRPFKGSFNVRLTPALHRQVAMAAAAEDSTLNAWVVEALERRLEHDAAAPVAMQKMAATYARVSRERRFAWQGRSVSIDDQGNQQPERTERVSMAVVSLMQRQEQKVG